MLRAQDLVYAASGRRLLDGVSIDLVAGEVHALLGPNGAGKSTLLRLLAQEIKPMSGRIELDGRALASFSAAAQARRRAVLPQSESLRFGFTAEQVVTLGRLPCIHQRPQREREIVFEALQLAGVAGLAQRRYPTLSGGERARVQFARVMAQIWEAGDEGARYLLLDEPTASLDLAHQHECLNVARRFAAGGVGVLAILHDPNLAMQYADRVTLLREGRVLACGAPQDVLDAEHIHALYGVDAVLQTVDGWPRPWIAVRPGC